jgi:hypothetical protein
MHILFTLSFDFHTYAVITHYTVFHKGYEIAGIRQTSAVKISQGYRIRYTVPDLDEEMS